MTPTRIPLFMGFTGRQASLRRMPDKPLESAYVYESPTGSTHLGRYADPTDSSVCT